MLIQSENLLLFSSTGMWAGGSLLSKAAILGWKHQWSCEILGRTKRVPCAAEHPSLGQAECEASSWNRTMTWIGRVLKVHPVPTPCLTAPLLSAITQGNTKVSKVCSSQSGREKKTTHNFRGFQHGMNCAEIHPIRNCYLQCPCNASRTTDDEHPKTQ